MAIYRGAGGSGDATTDATNQASVASDAAAAALVSQTAAANSAANASTSATNAANSATSASNSATSATASQTAAAVSESNAATTYDNFDDRYLGQKSTEPSVDNDGGTLLTGALYFNSTSNTMFVWTGSAWATISNTATSTSAAASAAAAATSESNAATSATNSANSASTASSQAGSATTSASNAATSASNASTSASAASGSASTASTQASNASTSATNASNSATSASTSATNASNSASTATTQAGIATTQASNASTSATNAANSATNSLANRDAAASSATAASGSASAAATSATGAATSATSAATSAASASAVALGNEPVRHSVRPSLLLDFANTKTLDPRITFTRASTGTYYDGKTTAKAEENLFLQSQTFDNASWTKAQTTVTTNSVAAPDATTTAETLTEDTSANYHFLQQAVTTSVSQSYAISVYGKNNGGTYLNLSFFNNASASLYAAAVFNLSTGAVTTTGANGAGYSVVSSSIAETPVGSGWYRCNLVVTNGSTTAANQIIIAMSNSGTIGSFGLETYTGTSRSIYIWGAQLEQRSSVTAYTPTTTAPITNYIPVLLTAASGIPRFEHNPTTGESLGLEIEEQRTNIIVQSEDFSTSWSKDNSGGLLPVVTVNQTIAPDGTLTADKIVFNKTGGVFSRILQGATATIGVTYTFSVWLKSATGSNVNLGIRLISTGLNCLVTNEWKRFTISTTASTTFVDAQILLFDSITGNDEIADVYVWGAQLEAGAFATSYIPTVASQVTRSAESTYIDGTAFTSVFNLAEGTIYSDAIRPSVSGNYSPFGFRTPTAVFDLVTGNFRFGFSGQSADLVQTPSSNSYKAGCSYTTGGTHSVSFNGSTATSTTGVQTTGPVTALFIGNGGTSSTTSTAFPLNGTLKKIAYYPKRLTNAELQGLTTV